MSLMPGFEQVPPDVWDAIAQRLGGAPGPPEPPAYAPPDLIAPTASTFRTRLADALAGVDNYAGPRPMEGGASAAVRGLLSGASQGFSNRVRTEGGRAEKEREAVNATRKAESDRNYANAQDTWRAKLTAFYRTQADERGKVRVTKRMAEDMGVPEAAGTLADPLDVSREINKRGGMGRTDKAVSGVLGVPEGTLMEPGTILGARNYLKPPTNNTMTPEMVQSRVDAILHGIATGNLNPDISLYGTNRDGLKSALAAAADAMGLDLATLRQNWEANKKGLSTANSPQQLRMRQAAQNIPVLLEQMAGKPDANGVHSGGVIADLNSTGLPWWNRIQQAVAKGTGHAAALKQYNILSSKLAMEQAFLMSGGNQPPRELYDTLKDQYAASDNPENIYAALATVDETVRGYQQSIGEVGPITPSSPYVPGASEQNPVGGPTFKQGAKPPAGTISPMDEFAKYRKKGK